jgi:Protein of unknown function (DUF1616)
MRTRHPDLLAAQAAAILCAAVAVTVPTTAVRAVFAVPLCLALPGYAVTSAAFARQRLPQAQALLLTVAMSLSILATGSLVLQLIPGGLRAASWTVLLLLVILGGCAVAARRRPAVTDRPRRARPGRRRFGEATLLVIAGLGTAAAFALAKTPLPARNVIGYTQLWMLPAGSASQPRVEIGVTSAETGSVAYRLELEAQSDRGTVHPLASFPFGLGPGQRFERVVPVAPAAPRSTERIVASLYRRDQPNAVYRYVVIRLPDHAPPGR